jgi:hypothetical protein
MNTAFNTKFPEYYDFYKIDFDNPSRNLREDIRKIPLAVSLGYVVKEGRNFGDCNKFEKGNVVIWWSRAGWGYAELIDGYYTNHRYYAFLDDALHNNENYAIKSGSVQ